MKLKLIEKQINTPVLILRKYQVSKLKKAAEIFNKWDFTYLSFEMRTGKTLSAFWLCQQRVFKNVLITAPNKARTSIEADYKKFNFGFNLYFITHGSLHNVSDEEINLIDVVISDEHHCFSGSLPKATKMVGKLKRVAWDKPLICMSGTPTPEGDWQLYYQFSVTKNSPFRKYKNAWEWINTYIEVQKRTKKSIPAVLKRDIATKNDVVDVLTNKFTLDSNYDRRDPRVNKIITLSSGENNIEVPLKILMRKWWEYVDMFSISNSPFVNHGELKRLVFNDYKKIRPEMQSKLDTLRDWFFVHLTQEEAGFKAETKEYKTFIKFENNEKIEKIIKSLVENQFYEDSEVGKIEVESGASLKQKIHQLSSGTLKLSDTDYVILDYSKALYIKNNINGKKVIYYKYKAEYEMLKEIFPNHTSDQTVFNTFDDKVYLGQFQSASKGVKLHTADVQIMFNIPHSAEQFIQSKARLQDYDREIPVVIMWLINESDYAIEKDIYNTVCNKEQNYTLKHYRRKYGFNI